MDDLASRDAERHHLHTHAERGNDYLWVKVLFRNHLIGILVF